MYHEIMTLIQNFLLCRDAVSTKNLGGSSNMVGKICPLVRIGLTDLLKTVWGEAGGNCTPPPSGIPAMYLHTKY